MYVHTVMSAMKKAFYTYFRSSDEVNLFLNVYLLLSYEINESTKLSIPAEHHIYLE